MSRRARSYRKAVAARPDHAKARNNLGLAQNEQEQFEAAADTFSALIAVKPFYAMARRNLGDMLREAGRAEAAVRAYRKGLALRPNDAGSYGPAVALTEKGRIAEAIDALRWPGSAADLQRLVHLWPSTAIA